MDLLQSLGDVLEAVVSSLQADCCGTVREAQEALATAASKRQRRRIVSHAVLLAKMRLLSFVWRLGEHSRCRECRPWRLRPSSPRRQSSDQSRGDGGSRPCACLCFSPRKKEAGRTLANWLFFLLHSVNKGLKKNMITAGSLFSGICSECFALGALGPVRQVFAADMDPFACRFIQQNVRPDIRSRTT